MDADSIAGTGLEMTHKNLLDDTVEASCDYSWQGTTYVSDTVVTKTLTTMHGCDSTVTLTLSISDMYRDSVKVEIIEGQSYEFYGVVYTEADTVEVMRPGMDGDCDSLRVLVITVIPDPEAIENVEMSKLVLRPSLLTVGQTVRADYNFTAADLASLKVEVYDIIGRKVEARTYNEKPVIIDAFHAAGVYTIRITSGTGLNLVGRVIVR